MSTAAATKVFEKGLDSKPQLMAEQKVSGTCQLRCHSGKCTSAAQSHNTSGLFVQSNSERAPVRLRGGSGSGTDTYGVRPLAMVTGGSAGIGYELAAQLAQRGHDVAISGHAERVHDAAEQLEREHAGAAVWACQADLATHDGVETFWRFVSDLQKPLAVACLNVGVSQGGAFVDNSLEDALKLIALNVTGLVHMAKRVVDDMAARGSGDRRILITSSVSATTPTPYETVYGPSKAFGFSFAESLREEVKGHGIVVTALLPGATDSEFHFRAGMGDTAYGDNSWKNDRKLVGKQGIDALFEGVDQVVGGDDATKQSAIDNRTTTEEKKAAKMAEVARPPSAQS